MNNDKYSKLLSKVFNLTHFKGRDNVTLETISKAADFLKLNYKGTYNLQQAYSDRTNLTKNMQFVHVTGTNGKGSVTKKIDKALPGLPGNFHIACCCLVGCGFVDPRMS